MYSMEKQRRGDLTDPSFLMNMTGHYSDLTFAGLWAEAAERAFTPISQERGLKNRLTRLPECHY